MKWHRSNSFLAWVGQNWSTIISPGLEGGCRQSHGICKAPRNFTSWCSSRSLQGRAMCRLWAAQRAESSSGDQHRALLVQQRQPCKGTALSETQTTCRIPGWGSCLQMAPARKSTEGRIKLSLCLQNTISYPFIRNNYFWIGARHPWEDIIFHITACS